MTRSNLVGCCTGSSAGLAPFNILSHEDCTSAPQVGSLRRVAHQPAGLHMMPRSKQRRQLVLERKLRKRFGACDEQRG